MSYFNSIYIISGGSKTLNQWCKICFSIKNHCSVLASKTETTFSSFHLYLKEKNLKCVKKLINERDEIFILLYYHYHYQAFSGVYIKNNN